MRRLLVAALAISVCLVGAPEALAHAGERTAVEQAGAGLYSEWPISSAAIVGAAAGIVLFLQGFLRLRRRGRRDHASLAQLVLFLAAVGVVLLALMSPLDPIGDRYLLSAHMLQHLVLFDAAPVLLLLALRRPLLFFVIPAGLLRAVGHGSLDARSEPWGGAKPRSSPR